MLVSCGQSCGSNEKVIGGIYDFNVGGRERISNID
jgi:hypothetical protein